MNIKDRQAGAATSGSSALARFAALAVVFILIFFFSFFFASAEASPTVISQLRDEAAGFPVKEQQQSNPARKQSL